MCLFCVEIVCHSFVTAGLSGMDGLPGQLGVRGSPGEKGDRGMTGFRGFDGTEGKNGLPGLKGEYCGFLLVGWHFLFLQFPWQLFIMFIMQIFIKK